MVIRPRFNVHACLSLTSLSTISEEHIGLHNVIKKAWNVTKGPFTSLVVIILTEDEHRHGKTVIGLTVLTPTKWTE